MPEVQEIIKKYGKEYKEKHKLLPHIAKTMGAIEKCRTGELGAHIDVCDECGYEEIAYNSCRNRHCPNCQIMKKLKWIEARKEEVLNIKYYHVVFTIPSELYNIVYQNQSKMYNVLFKAASETLQELAQDKKYLGAEIGFARKMYDRGAKNGFNQFLMDAEKNPSLYIDLARYLAVRLAKEAVKCNAADISLSLDIEVEGKKYFTRLSSITFLSETKNLDERAMEVARNLLNSSVICSMEDNIG